MSNEGADGRADANIGAQILWGHRPPRRSVTDIDRVAVPRERPSGRVQSDEAEGRWIAWDPVDQEWDEVDEPIVAGPADPAGTPSDPLAS